MRFGSGIQGQTVKINVYNLFHQQAIEEKKKSLDHIKNCRKAFENIQHPSTKTVRKPKIENNFLKLIKSTKDKKQKKPDS